MKENEDAATGADESSTKPEKEKTGNNSKFILIGILAGVLILNTVVAFVLIQATKPKNVQEEMAKMKADSLKQAQETATIMGATTAEAPVEAIVNIAGTDGERFLKAAVIFEYDDVKYPELGAELLRRAPKFKNVLINQLSRLTLVELTEPDAKVRISKEYMRLINSSLPSKMGEIREVMFTSFIIQ